MGCRLFDPKWIDSRGHRAAELAIASETDTRAGRGRRSTGPTAGHLPPRQRRKRTSRRRRPAVSKTWWCRMGRRASGTVGWSGLTGQSAARCECHATTDAAPGRKSWCRADRGGRRSSRSDKGLVDGGHSDDFAARAGAGVRMPRELDGVIRLAPNPRKADPICAAGDDDCPPGILRSADGARGAP